MGSMITEFSYLLQMLDIKPITIFNGFQNYGPYNAMSPSQWIHPKNEARRGKERFTQ